MLQLNQQDILHFDFTILTVNFLHGFYDILDKLVLDNDRQLAIDMVELDIHIFVGRLVTEMHEYLFHSQCFDDLPDH